MSNDELLIQYGYLSGLQPNNQPNNSVQLTNLILLLHNTGRNLKHICLTCKEIRNIKS